MIAGSAVLLALAPCSAESGEFDAGSAMHFDAPVIVEIQAFDLQRRVSVQTQIGRREATEYQRKVAEANARAYMAAQLRSKGAATPSKPGKTGGTTPEAKKKDELQSRQAAKAKLPRYVAVDTVKDARSAPGTKKVVMIWDTRSESLANNYVYDVSNPPPIGSTEKFDTYSVQYIGSGVAAAR